LEQNIEIEFKTSITKKKYLELLEKLKLTNNIYTQVNYYFDTPTLDLNKEHKLIRIRKKPSSIRLTLKEAGDAKSIIESHVIISEATANNLIEQGFNAKKYFKNIDMELKYITKLENNRSRIPYNNGELFLDECIYNGIVDYEIEFEVTSYSEGKKEWESLLKDFEITEVFTHKKSHRALMSAK
jgi:uncharacterized protein YjbK